MPQISPEMWTIIACMLGLFLALFPTLRTLIKDRDGEVVERTKVNMLLVQIQTSLEDIKRENIANKAAQERTDERVDKIIERLVVAEQSSKQSHKRMDDHINKS